MGRVFLQCEDKKQLQRQEYLLRDDWKDVLQYWLYVLFATVYKGNIIKFNNGLPILRRDTAQTRLRAVFL